MPYKYYMKADLNFMRSVFKNSLNLNNYELNLDSEFESVPQWDSFRSYENKYLKLNLDLI